MQNYRRPDYRPKVVLGIVKAFLYRLWPENKLFREIMPELTVIA